MNTKRFFHIRPLVKRGRKFTPYEKGGATVLVQSTDKLGFVSVSFVLCSKKDNFVKKVGREQASQPDIQQVMPLRYLGKVLEDIANDVSEACKLPTLDTDYNYTLKYFLPKE